MSSATKELQDQIKSYKALVDPDVCKLIAYKANTSERNVLHFISKNTTDTALEIHRAFNDLLNGEK